MYRDRRGTMHVVPINVRECCHKRCCTGNENAPRTFWPMEYTPAVYFPTYCVRRIPSEPDLAGIGETFWRDGKVAGRRPVSTFPKNPTVEAVTVRGGPHVIGVVARDRIVRTCFVGIRKYRDCDGALRGRPHGIPECTYKGGRAIDMPRGVSGRPLEPADFVYQSTNGIRSIPTDFDFTRLIQGFWSGGE